MDWYLKAIDKNGDAVNNIGVMYRDGLGVDKNRKVAHALFLTVHLTGMGGESTVMRANRNSARDRRASPSQTVRSPSAIPSSTCSRLSRARASSRHPRRPQGRPPLTANASRTWTQLPLAASASSSAPPT